jgi:hypothetical protein
MAWEDSFLGKVSAGGCRERGVFRKDLRGGKDCILAFEWRLLGLMESEGPNCSTGKGSELAILEQDEGIMNYLRIIVFNLIFARFHCQVHYQELSYTVMYSCLCQLFSLGIVRHLVQKLLPLQD